MKLTTEQKLARAEAGVKRWQTRVKRAANKLAAYRAHVTRIKRKMHADALQIRPQGTGRAFDLD